MAFWRQPSVDVERAKIAILHRNPERFALLYRLLWRLRGNHDLLEVASRHRSDHQTTRATAEEASEDAHPADSRVLQLICASGARR